jgi:hypothetical protein
MGECMSARLEQQVQDYQQWRDELVTAITSYQAWLDDHSEFEAQQSLKIFDLVESLKQDHVTLAFVAEFSRGKSELINALFFADFKQRLLPSDAGRTTMCPTELFYDPREEPFIRLLPIETRYRDETISQLKRKPIEWVSTKLNLGSASEMMEALQSLTQTKLVAKVEARTLGLWDDQDPALQDMLRPGDRVEIPAWRHALINYPHPLLKSGLAILDTPGLNALGAEPELTLSMIPNAHAVLFLLALDTGVTKSDMEIWQKHVRAQAKHTIAVLNKIDVLWDDLKPWEKIQESVQRQQQATAQMLGLPIANVLALSAQKALVAKIKGDAALLAKSGIERLEQMLANDIIPRRREILRKSVTQEIGAMVLASYNSVRQQLAATRHEQKELSSLSGKNKEVIHKMLTMLDQDRGSYDETVKSFNVTRGVITQQGRMLLNNLSIDRLDEILEKAHGSIKGSWTTAGLSRGMQQLIRQTAHQYQHIHKHAKQIKGLVDAAYIRFHVKHGFERSNAPELSIDQYMEAIRSLAQRSEEFCRDPINIMTEKHFLIRKFFLSVAGEARVIFERTRVECEAWLRNVLAPLITQINDHKIQIERRLDNIKKIHDNIDSLQERLAELESTQSTLSTQLTVLEGILTKLQRPRDPEPVQQRTGT